MFENPVLMSVGGEKRRQKHEAIKWGLGKQCSSFGRDVYRCVPSLLQQV